ncbi:hypothetical protein B0H19DRAFT_1340051 [Mycena capillaripes]|nr:hypothetical protein B0H19DRAFT_1340051 [Mycena capillaripes]
MADGDGGTCAAASVTTAAAKQWVAVAESKGTGSARSASTVWRRDEMRAQDMRGRETGGGTAEDRRERRAPAGLVRRHELERARVSQRGVDGGRPAGKTRKNQIAT